MARRLLIRSFPSPGLPPLRRVHHILAPGDVPIERPLLSWRALDWDRFPSCFTSFLDSFLSLPVFAQRKW